MPRLSTLLIPAFFAACAVPAWAQNALDGVDVVSLRDSGRAVQGDASIATRWKGQSWAFANEANRAAFEADPRSYAPGFSGNCPVALSDGKKRPGSAQFPVVLRGRLYLTVDRAAQGELRADPDTILHRASEMWSKLR